MIKHLKIQNYAIIDQLEIQLTNGLNIITGETGAGKSILLGATGLILGQRADTKVQYQQGVKTIVEAMFDLSDIDVEEYFQLHELDYDVETIVRREISASGKSRAFINDTPVSLSILQGLSNQLVDLHQQFDTLALQNERFQLKALDALAENQTRLTAYKTSYDKYVQLRRELKEKSTLEAEAIKEQSFLEFQAKEFEELGLEIGEQARLEEEQELLANGEQMIETIRQAEQMMDEGPQPTIQGLKNLVQSLNQSGGSTQAFKQLKTQLDSIIIDLEEWYRNASRLGDQLESNPARLNEVEERLNRIFQMQRKHQVNSDVELLEIDTQINEKLLSMTSLQTDIQKLEKTLEEQKVKLDQQCALLTKKRIKASRVFEKEVIKRLAMLSMNHARIQVGISQHDEFTPTGKDSVDVLFSANKGGDLLPIKKVASGGELSRLSLCIKSVVAERMSLPTLIFDEIDAGISGEVARKMGTLIHGLAQHHQILMITHSPQIASMAHQHFFVKKKEEADRTLASIDVLDSDGRIIEIAKMLSGDPPTASAMENARELITS